MTFLVFLRFAILPVFFVISTVFLAMISAFTFFGSQLHAETDIDAKNCEIFIDKFYIGRGTHGSVSLIPRLKIIKDRLDGSVVKAGYWTKIQTTRYDSTILAWQTSYSIWYEKSLVVASPVGDYYRASEGLFSSSSYGTTAQEVAFFVTTDRGTTYWHKAADGSNFIFDRNAFEHVYNVGGQQSFIEVPTQNSSLVYYNSQNCY